MALRSTMSSALSVGAPWTCERKPSSANFSARVIPDRPACRLAVTSCTLEPIEETMPMPVTTTRLIHLLSTTARRRCVFSGQTGTRGTEQADANVPHVIYALGVGLQPAVGDAEDQLAFESALHVDAVDHLLDRWKHLSGELNLAHAERAPSARQAKPAEEESRQLPESV